MGKKKKIKKIDIKKSLREDIAIKLRETVKLFTKKADPKKYGKIIQKTSKLLARKVLKDPHAKSANPARPKTKKLKKEKPSVSED
jgi:hypothetical protein